MQLLVFPLSSYTLQISIYNLDSLPHLAFILWRVLPDSHCFIHFQNFDFVALSVPPLHGQQIYKKNPKQNQI